MGKPQFRPIAPLDVDDAALEAVNERLGVPKMVRAQARPSPQEASVVARGVQIKPPEDKLSVLVPAYLMDAVRQEAARKKVTVRHVVMAALKAQGFSIRDEDLVGDGRRRER